MSKKSYDQEFKVNAAKYYLDHEAMTADEKAEYLGVSKAALSRWVKQYRETGTVDGPGTGNYASEKDREIDQLKRELRDVKAANNVLKKAIRILED